MHKHKHNKKNKLVPSLVAISLIVLVTAFLYVVKHRNDDAPHNTANEVTNYSPPTETEQNLGDQQKEKIVDREEMVERNADQPVKTTAHVIITSAEQMGDTIEVRSFIPDHYQDGTCTITFTSNFQTVSKETPAYRDASTTICTNPLFKRSEFPHAGTWHLVVQYSSEGAQGISESTSVAIN